MSWMSGTEYLDSLVRNYLSFRGFTNSLKTFDSELKIDKDKGFRIDKIMQLILSFITNYDIESLKSYWLHLESRFFSRYAKSHESTIKRFKTDIYHLYVVRAVQYSKPKVLEFFEKMTQDLQNQPEWKDWFAIPFIANPESNPTFSLYFSRQWADSFLLSLHNFLSALFMCMPEPELMSAVYDDGNQIMKLERENSSLKKKLKEKSEKASSQDHSLSSSETDLRQGANSSPASQSLPNYVKAMGVPGTLAETVPTVTQPKKNPLFGFVTRQTSTSPKTSSNQLVKQSSQDNGLVNSAMVATAVKTITKKTSIKESKSKGLSELEAQRRELFGSTKKNVKSVASSAANFSNIPVQNSNSKPSLLEDNGSPRTHAIPKISQQSIKSSTEIKDSIPEGSLDKFQKEGSATSMDDTRSPNGAILNVNNVTSTQSRTETITTTTSYSAIEEFEASYEFVNNLHKMATADKHNSQGSPRIADKDFVDSAMTTDKLKHTDDVEVLYDEKPFLVLSKDVFLEHHSGISQCRFDSIGTTIASIDTQGVVKVWKNEPRITTLATVMFQSPIQCLEWCNKPDNMLLLGTANGSINFFNTTNNHSIQTITVDDAYPWVTGIATHPSGSAFVCSCVRPSADSSKYLSASNQGILQIWSLRGGQEKLIHCLKGRGSSCELTCMEYNHNGNLLVAGDYQGRITLYDMKTHESLHGWDAHHGPVCCLQFSFDETLLFSLGSDCQLLAWSIHQLSHQAMKFTIRPTLNGTGAILHTLDRTLPKGKLFSFDPEGKHVLMAVGNKGVVYKVNSIKQTLTQVLSLPEHKSPVTAVDWTSSKTCGHCLTGSSDGKVQVTTLLTQ